MLRYTTAALALVAAAGIAAGGVVFEAGMNDDGIELEFIRGTDTFTGLNQSGNGVRLAVSEAGAGGATHVFNTDFSGSFALTNAQSFSLGGGQYLHSYSLSGTVTFTEVGGSDLLTLVFADASFTALGTQDRWSSTATMQGSSEVASVAYTWSGQALADVGLSPGALGEPADFGFALNLLREGQSIDFGNLGIGLDADGLPDTTDGRWYARGVFTGFVIPSAGTVSLLGAGALMLGVRRRRPNAA